MIKEISIFAGSIISGLYIGYKLGIKKAQKFADEQVNSTKEALKNYYEKKLSEKDEIINENKEKQINDMGVDPGVNDDDPVNVFKDPRVQFPRIIKAVQPEPDLKFPASKLDVKIAKRPNDLPPTAIDTPDGYPDPNDQTVEPYLIRDVDYGTIDNFEMQELILWECGTVTTDDASYDIVSPKYLFNLLPEGWSNMFGWGDEDRYIDCLYFRNNKEKKDVQIAKQAQTFKEWVEKVCPGRLEELDED